MDFNEYIRNKYPYELITIARTPKAVIRYAPSRDFLIFQHEDIRDGAPVHISGEALALMSRDGVLDSNLNAWVHGVPWEDILA